MHGRASRVGFAFAFLLGCKQSPGGLEQQPAATAPQGDRRPAAAPVLQFAAGRSHACALGSGGEIWCWGANDYGQLGDETFDPAAEPVRPKGVPPATEIAAGLSMTCAATEPGQVWCWGRNHAGQTGAAVAGRQPLPRPVPGVDNAVAVAVDITGVGLLDDYVACAALADRGLKCWGGGATPRRTSSTPAQFVDVEFAGETLCGLDARGNVFCTEKEHDTNPAWRRQASSIARLECGANACVALTSIGRMIAWDEQGPLEFFVDGPDGGRPLSAAVRDVSRFCVLTTDGIAYCGFAVRGDRIIQLHEAWRWPDARAIAVSAGRGLCAASAEAELRCTGYYRPGLPPKQPWPSPQTRADPLRGRRASALVAGPSGYICAEVDPAADFECWATTEDARYGPRPETGVRVDVMAATEADGCHKLSGDAPLQCSGGVFDAHPLGAKGRLVDTTKWTFARRDGATCAVDPGREVWCGDAEDFAAVGVPDAAELAMGSGYGCARQRTGAVTCWSTAQLGGDRRKPITLVRSGAKAVAVSGGMVCVATARAGATCWGAFEPSDGHWRETGPTPVQGNLGALRHLGAGGGTFCGLQADGRLSCWGPGYLGGAGSTTLRAHTRASLDAPDRVKDLVVADRQACTRDSKGRIECIGDVMPPIRKPNDAARPAQVPEAVARVLVVSDPDKRRGVP